MTRYVKRRRKNSLGKRIRQSGFPLVPAIVSALLTAAAVYIVFFTSIFELREVRLNGGRYLPADSLRTVAEEFIGSNIFTARTSMIRAGIGRFPEVRRVDFRRRLFHTIDCYVQEREPVALIADGTLSAVDEEGVVIPSRSGEWNVDLPLISGISSEETADGEGRERLMRALEVLRLLKDFDFSPAEQLSEIHIDGEDIVLVWMGQGSLIHVGRDGYPEKIRKFRAVYGALEEEEVFPESIDLRFERQVVIR
ncbi:MAG TPA: cell division protein FtsQ/DivIB [Candidatus Krumholzibacterium sp.]|nr:cell division protein FtsQ/DivIB [Candidatus Krumholzibacterium sp.]